MPDPPPLVIVGAGGLGKEVARLVELVNAETPTWSLVGFVDDDERLHGDTVLGYPVRGSTEWISRREACSYVLAIGDGEARRTVARRLDAAGAQPATLVAPSVSIHRTVDLGPGSILCEGAAPTVDLTTGAHVVVDQGATVGHDSRLDAFVTLHPGAHISGGAHLETGVRVGAGAVVLPNLSVGANATIGAGAVVTADLPSGCTAVGVPARPVS